MAKKPSDKSGSRLTPMLTQYLEIKAQHPGAILLFRMGDFFETFFEDAQTLARITGVTLTSRDARSENPVPLAGVPHHALDVYLTRLLHAGLTVAICEQVEDPATAKGLVRREVVEVISPGTATTLELIDDNSGRYCLAWRPGENDQQAGWALLDATTGDFRCGQERSSLASLCQRHPVKEVIVSEDTDSDTLKRWRTSLPELVVNTANTAWFHPAFARRTLLDHFQVGSLTPFGLDDPARDAAATAAGALLRYLGALSLRRPDQVTSLTFSVPGDRLALDEETLRNLEIFRTFRGERGLGTLVHHIDGTVTPMGRRLLEMRLAEAMTDLDELRGWHDGVAAALADAPWRRELRDHFRPLGDLERHAARTSTGRLGPAGLRSLGTALRILTGLRRTNGPQGRPDHPIPRWLGAVADFDELASDILKTIVTEAPGNVRKPGYVAVGVNAELDRRRAIVSNSRGFLAGLQAQEREASGISSLKVGFNKVFGYYFEVTSRHLDKVPAHYQQVQTLVNAGRFHTEELKATERIILDAEETIEQLETEIFQALLRTAAARLPALREAARLVAQADLMLGFAETAERHRYCRPECDDSLQLRITGGRHPVVEQLLGSDFIGNDTALDGETDQVILLTGPNMGGKSTYLRQVALITLMAQAGSFVPAEGALIGIADRIFTRVGASDNLARGESTFYTEMSETAHILHQMTRRSLVVLDEIGRGTSTYDGLSLAWAITEFLAAPDGPQPRSIFATHYHELTDLEGDLPGLSNFRLEVKEWEGRIVFMHAVVPGCSDKSYGIHVARLAGLPEMVLRRAQEILATLSAGDERDHEARRPGGASLAADRGIETQLRRGSTRLQATLFHEPERDALRALQELDLDRISPVDAFMWLVRLKNSLRNP